MEGRLLVVGQFVIGGRLVTGQFVNLGRGRELVKGCSRAVTLAKPFVGDVNTGLSCSSPLQVGLKVGGMASIAHILPMERGVKVARIRSRLVVFIWL